MTKLEEVHYLLKRRGIPSAFKEGALVFSEGKRDFLVVWSDHFKVFSAYICYKTSGWHHIFTTKTPKETYIWYLKYYLTNVLPCGKLIV